MFNGSQNKSVKSVVSRNNEGGGHSGEQKDSALLGGTLLKVRMFFDV